MVENVIILAGGSGTRLWPASRKVFPKQFLDLGMGESLFAKTLKRAFSLGVKGEIIVVTHKDHTQLIVEEINRFLGEFYEDEREIKNQQVVVLQEPLARNTAPAITFALRYLEIEKREGESVLVLPADHIINDSKAFRFDVEKASIHAKEAKLVTFGLVPTKPETGYGYIEAGDDFKDDFLVRRFREKPDLETAKRFVKMGNFYWNSGIFVFRVDKFLQELSSFAPDIRHSFLALEEIGLDMDMYYGNGDSSQSKGSIVCEISETLESIYEKVPSISVDYAVMEKTSSASMVVATFDWSDVGSWDEVARLALANSKKGGDENTFEVDSRGNYVLSDIPVAIVGLDDVIVVQKKGALLICKKGESQLIRRVVSVIREKGREDLL